MIEQHADPSGKLLHAHTVEPLDEQGVALEGQPFPPQKLLRKLKGNKEPQTPALIDPKRVMLHPLATDKNFPDPMQTIHLPGGAKLAINISRYPLWRTLPDMGLK